MGRVQTSTVRKPDAGVQRNAPFEQLDPRALIDANNIRIRPGRIEKIKGWVAFSATALPSPVMLTDVASFFSGTQILVVASQKRLYSYNTATGVLDDITGADLSASASWPHLSAMWLNTLIYCNAVDVVKKWTGAGNIAALGGLTDAEPGGVVVNSCKALCAAGPFLLLGNTTEAGNPQPVRVRWPVFNTLETWKNDASGNGQAGYMDVSEETSQIMAIVPIGNYFAVYKERSVQLLTYFGLPVIWGRRQIITGSGLISPRAVVPLGDYHICAFTDNFYIFNGASLQRIGDNIRDDFFASLDPNAKNLMFGFHLEDKAEVIFAYAAIGATYPNRAVVYNYLLNAWSFRDFAFNAGTRYLTQSSTPWSALVGNWSAQTLPWNTRVYQSNAPVPIVGDAVANKIYQLDSGDTAAGAAIDGYFTTALTDFGAPDKIKRVTRLKIAAQNLFAACNVYVVTADHPQGDLTYNGPYTFNPTTDEFLDFDLSARYVAFKMEGPNGGEPFVVSAWTWEVSMDEDR